ncbi:MAG TPA: LysR substrate-binding domain-containing protein [Geminicoccus sp.]|uniref:LysR substrate-binding domain-containing protein n=1 Tax=Geminicoccus sp. TaxID=2024832 RepID=UPI002E36CFFF|nr:LysR substrate-binding domain-containing protein [Geminicoccus sp.]HEX2527356.1 LysR substrate-binding domain-containing protein [Geminicoccus sp.]
MERVLDPDLLTTLVAIAETGSFTGAAERVLRSQSAVSMQIKRLEELVGRPLFLREGRVVTLTAAGEALLLHARRILRAHREAIAEFSERELAGEVTIGTPDDYAATYLPSILSLFSEAHPKLTLNVVCEPSLKLSQRVREGSVDIALTTRGNGEVGGTIVHAEPLIWMGSKQHCVHERDPLPLAVFGEHCCFRTSMLRALAEHGGRRARIAVSSVSIAGIYAALEAGLAVSALASSNLTPSLRSLTGSEGFPPLADVELLIQRAAGRRSLALDELEERIVEHFRRWHRMAQAA